MRSMVMNGLLSRLALAAVLAAPMALADAPVCDASSFTGAYGYKLSGIVYDSYGYMYFLNSVGRIVSDGAGSITGTNTYSFDGTVIRQTFTGTYTVNEDCTGTLTMATSGSGTANYDFVLVNNNQEATMVQTDSGFSLSGDLKMQNPPTAVTTTPATDPTDPAPSDPSNPTSSALKTKK